MSGDGAAGPAPVVPVPAPGQEKRNRFREPVGTVGTGPRLRFEPLGAFLERTAKLPPRTWLVEGLIPDSGRVFIVAEPSAGKTWLAMVAAKTAAGAGRPVRLVLTEGGHRATGDRFRNLDFPPDRLGLVEVLPAPDFLLTDPAPIRELADWLRGASRPVLVLDPFVSFFHGDENSTGEVNARARAPLDKLVNANPEGLLILTHHMSKDAAKNSPHSMHAARGSGVLNGWADVQLNLAPESMAPGSGQVAFRVEVTKDRDGERGARRRVAVSLGTGEVSIEDVGQDGPDDRPQIRRVLQEAREPLKTNAIKKLVGGNGQRVGNAIRRMAEDGELVKPDPNRHGYVLAPERAPDSGEATDD